MPSLRGGGAERTLINLLHKIDYSRYEIDLVVASKNGRYIEDVPDSVEVTYLIKNAVFARVINYLHRTFSFKRFYKKKMQNLGKSYDVGISFLDSNITNLLFYTDQIERRVAFVHSSYLTHDNYEQFYKHEKYNKKLREKRYSRLDGIYFVSKDSMEEFTEVLGEYSEMEVIYNLIDGEAVRVKADLGPVILQEDRFCFSAFGSLIPVKGFDRLIRAVAIVRDKGYVFSLHIAGSGPEEANLRRQVRELGLEDVVTLHGFLDNPYPLMNQSDVFVMSSISEALPTVLCEAMILGVPSLVTNCSGCRGLVNRGEYGLMAEQNSQSLAKKMIEYLENPDLVHHYRKKSQERAQLFDDDNVLKRYYEIFDGKPRPSDSAHKIAVEETASDN